MSSPCRLLRAPAGLVVERKEIEPNRLVVYARAAAPFGERPDWGSQSSSVHSRYRRLVQNPSAHGRAVAIVVAARRFRCRTGTCSRSTFAERLPDAVDGSHTRRSRRLDLIANQLGLALGGRLGERFASRLSLALRADTLSRIVRKQVSLPATRPRVVGVDDFAWHRNHRYGGIVCNLKRRRIVGLSPDREMATVAAWFRDRQDVEIVSRDRGGGYSDAVRLRPENAEAVLGVVEGDTLDEAGERFLSRWFRR